MHQFFNLSTLDTIFLISLRSICTELKMKLLVYILFLLVTTTSFGQYSNGRSKSEFGFLVGGSFYIGDLNPIMPFRNTNLAYGIVYRYNIHSRLSFRANFTYGNVEGYDSQSKEAINIDRNLSFQSTIYEGAAGIEFNYFPFQLGHDRYKGTAYLLAEIGIFKMNPKTFTDAGEEIELQSIGTEGQGSSTSSKSNYKLTQLVMPVGVGLKLALGSRVSLNFEFGLRKTFTDYLDDVGGGSYIDPVLLVAENGPLAAELANRSLSGSRYGPRGNSTTKDWYVFSGMMITFRLGQPGKCYKG